MSVKYEPMKQTNYTCRRCNSKVMEETEPSLKKEYDYYCPNCDENMMSMEVRLDIQQNNE